MPSTVARDSGTPEAHGATSTASPETPNGAAYGRRAKLHYSSAGAQQLVRPALVGVAVPERVLELLVRVVELGLRLRVIHLVPVVLGLPVPVVGVPHVVGVVDLPAGAADVLARQRVGGRRGDRESSGGYEAGRDTEGR